MPKKIVSQSIFSIKNNLKKIAICVGLITVLSLIIYGAYQYTTYKGWRRYQSDRIPLSFKLPPNYLVTRCDSDVILEAFRQKECLTIKDQNTSDTRVGGKIVVEETGPVTKPAEYIRNKFTFPGLNMQFSAVHVGNKVGYHDATTKIFTNSLTVYVYANNVEYVITLTTFNKNEITNILRSFHF